MVILEGGRDLVLHYKPWDAKRKRHIVICGLPAPLYNILPHYLMNGKIFEEKLLNTKYVF